VYGASTPKEPLQSAFTQKGVVALWALHSSLPHGLQMSNPSMIHLMLYAEPMPMVASLKT